MDEIAALIAQLSHPGRPARRALIGLIHSGAAAVEPLIRALNNSDPQTANYAVIALGKIGDRRAVNPLRKLLQQAEVPNTKTVIRALRRLEGIAPLYPLLDDPRAEIRKATINEIGNLSAPSETAPWLHALHDPDRSVIAAAAWILRRKDPTLTVPALLTYLDHAPADNYNQIIDLLQSISPQALAAAARHPLPEIRKKAFDMLKPHSLPYESLHPFFSGFSDPDPAVRLAAVNALGWRTQFPEVIAALTEALNDSNSEIRFQAACNRPWDERSLEPLLATLFSSTPPIPWNALNILLLHPTRAMIPPLLKKINMRVPEHRFYAVQLLSRIDETLFDDALLRKILRDSSERVRTAGFVILAHRGPGALPQLLQIIHTGPPLNNDEASQALAALGPTVLEAPLLDLLQSPPFHLRDLAVQTLGRLQEPRYAPIFQKVLEHENEKIQLAALRALERTPGPEARRILIAQLQHRSLTTRSAALGILRYHSDPESREGLFAALQDQSLHQEAAIALGQRGDPRAAEPLFKMLVEEHQNRGYHIAISLVQTHNKTVVPRLLECLDHPILENYQIRMGVIEALGWLHDRRAVPPLLELLKEAFYSDNEGDIWFIAEALGNLHAQEALAPLLEIFESDLRLRDTLARALIALGNPCGIKYILDNLASRSTWEIANIYTRDLAGLSRTGDPRTYDIFIRVLETGTPNQQQITLRGLSHIGDPRSLELFLHILPEKNYARYRWTLGGLARIGKPAVAPLLELLENAPDFDLRSRAAWILGRIGDPRAVEPLCRALTSPHIRLRYRALQALARFDDPAARAALLTTRNDPVPLIRTAARALS